MDFASTLTGTTESVLFWGENRVAASIAAYAFALRSDPTFLWLDVRGANGGGSPMARLYDPLELPPHRYEAVTVPELTPQPPPSREAVSAVVLAEELDATVEGLIQFLRLPQVVQRLVSHAVPDGSPTVLLATSADRIAHFYLERVESTRAHIATLKGLGVKFVASYVGPTRRDRWAFDHVFRVEGGSERDWASATVTADREEVPDGTAGARATQMREIDSVVLAMPVAEDI